MTPYLPLPVAWLGYAGFSPRGPIVRICAWCPDKAQAEHEALQCAHVITHTICPTCAQTNFARYLGENN